MCNLVSYLNWYTIFGHLSIVSVGEVGGYLGMILGFSLMDLGTILKSFRALKSLWIIILTSIPHCCIQKKHHNELVLKSEQTISVVRNLQCNANDLNMQYM